MGSQNDNLSHATRIESDLACHPNGIERCFNTVRVLDDMTDHSSLFQLLRIWPRSEGSITEQQYITLLEQVCRSWDDYLDVKRYIADVFLCVWVLNVPINIWNIYYYWSNR